MTSKTEAATIRAQLKLRKTVGGYPFSGDIYEVWTTIHGSNGLFRWIRVDQETYEWYKQRFNLQKQEEIVNHEQKEDQAAANNNTSAA